MNANPELLDRDKRSVRIRMGCDEDCAAGAEQYAITCTRCDGSGTDPETGGLCGRCGEGRYVGYLPQRRCPRSQMTPAISMALDALSWVRRGVLPEDGGMMAQSPSFLQFVSTFEGEIHRVEAERQEQERLKAMRSKKR